MPCIEEFEEERKKELQSICKEACQLEDDLNFAAQGYINVCESHKKECRDCREEIECMEHAGNEGNPIRAYRNYVVGGVSTEATPASTNFDWVNAWRSRQDMNAKIKVNAWRSRQDMDAKIKMLKGQ